MTTTFKSRRITYTYCQTIHAAPDAIFPLLCPQRETEWYDGWRYSMIYSESGLVEKMAVFRTPLDNEEDTIWVVTKHDPQNHEVEFARFTHQSRVCVSNVSVKPKDQHSSHVYVRYAFTTIAPAGDAFLENYTEDVFRKAMAFWESAMNHFLATGEKLKKG